ncbi:hypothetical protein F2Q68_00036226 [Brassica cretica]|uniref:Uncharacterized protein n=1 Tax=Brassica cretica TaxID=69181 RepID=A0A8S9H4H4_BRACR|nr:hypothetical protein F2Q68_00036226 [Brassica cretica]
MPSNTPPIFLSNDRQLASFITLFKKDIICIYVSLTANKGRHDVNINQEYVVRENDAADFGSFGNVQYETMKPSHETMKPSLETMRPSQCGRVKPLRLGTYSVARRN